MRELHHAEEGAAVRSGWSGCLHCRDPDRAFWDQEEHLGSVARVGARGGSGRGREPRREVHRSGGHHADSGKPPVSRDSNKRVDKSITYI